ncbi:MAG: type II toxin-antitoxin system RelE/ParE family toxin [Acidobacteriia bacterium]|nr:type II toxin-antitoxin system RelE/ParE family toxin [Terriglobia bacterium]
MTYSLAILPAALRQLTELPRLEQRRLKERIDRLAVDPRPPGVKRLHGRREYLRLRSGDYRAIYTVDDDRFTVLIIKLGHRREVYRTL